MGISHPFPAQATGADIKASLERLDVHEAYDETGRRLLFADAHTSWGVDIHASAGSARARDVARRGEDMCARLLPRVPCPRAPPGEWAPPGFGADYLAYLVALLRCAAVLSSDRKGDVILHRAPARRFVKKRDP